MNLRAFNLQDLDNIIDENTINNINKFAKKFENIFKNDDNDLVDDKVPISNTNQSLPMTKFLAHDMILLNDSYQLIFDVPGVSKDNIIMEVISQNSHTLNILQIKVEKKTDDKLKYLKRERSCGCFVKQINAPLDSDLLSINAKCENGLLIVNIPKISNPYNNIKVNIS